jgi:excisionase family DNA binding protein
MAKVSDVGDVGLRSMKSAAHFLGVSKTQLYRLHEAGKIEMVKIGKATRVTQASLDLYLKGLRRKPRSDRYFAAKNCKST